MSDMPNDQPTSVPSGADSAGGNAEPKRNGLAASIIAARDSLNEQNWTRGIYFGTNKHGVCMCAHGALQAVVNPLVAAVFAEDGSYVERMACSLSSDAQDTLAVWAAADYAGTEALEEAARAAAETAEMATKAVAAAELAAESVAARAAAAAAAETATEAAARAGAARAAAAALAATAMATVARAGAARAAMSAADYAVSVPVSEVAMSDTGASTAFAAYVSDVYDCRPGWVRNDTAAGNLDAHFILGLVGLTSQYNDSEKNTLDDIKKKMTEAADLADMLGVQSDHVI